jgi:hypothetical protein
VISPSFWSHAFAQRPDILGFYEKYMFSLSFWAMVCYGVLWCAVLCCTELCSTMRCQIIVNLIIDWYHNFEIFRFLFNISTFQLFRSVIHDHFCFENFELENIKNGCSIFQYFNISTFQLLNGNWISKSVFRVSDLWYNVVQRIG